MKLNAVIAALTGLCLLAPNPALSDESGAQGVDAGWQDLATNFNAVVWGDFTASGGDTEYRLAVGGTATFSGGYSVGMSVVGLPLPTYTHATTDILIVGGDLHDGAFGVNGNIVYGGTRYGPTRYMPDGNAVERVTNIAFDASGNVSRDGAGRTWSDLLERAGTASAVMAALEDWGVAAIDFTNPYQRFLTATNESLNVFNLDAAEWNMTSSQIVIDAPTGSAVFVNIHGGPVAITNSSIELVGVDQRQVIYNYADAARITTKSFLHPGSVLAPYASAALSGGAVNGTAVFGGDVTTTIGFSFNNFPYAGHGFAVDGDGDGLPDWWELLHFGDLSHDGNGDSDGDGLTNAQEWHLGTNPAASDTDGDGYTDAEEIAAGSDPLDPASTPKITLGVTSFHGSCIPAAGTYQYDRGAGVTCSILSSPLTCGNTQYVCTGWTGTGSVPASGTNLEISAALQTNSVIVWQWATNFWLGLSVDGRGALTATSAWCGAGTLLSVTAEPLNEYDYFAGWAGDVEGLNVQTNPLTVAMDRPRSLRALFGSILPPDPSEVAPAVRQGEVSILARNAAFLYSGANPVQTGADTNAFEVKRLAVVRGNIFTRDGAPLPGVTVTVSGHPEYGQTLSRLDGGYDLAVNGGDEVSVDFRKAGYLAARRAAKTGWQGFSVLPDVRLITADPVATEVQFGSGVTNAQVARAGAVTDADGTRQATVIFPSGVQAYVTDGASVTQAVTRLTLRFTEYTVGTNGPACMPAPLPSSSAYTYCVELAADQANGQTVVFDRPVSFYVENFLGMPVGLNVPAAYYEWNGCPGWMAEEDGVVLMITGTDASGLAEIDLDGDGIAETSAVLAGRGITEGERAELANLYAAGTTLWRAQVAHFSPLDLNFPYYLVEDPDYWDYYMPELQKTAENAVQMTGGSIAVESGTFNESLQLAGTGMELDYTSARSPKFKGTRTIRMTGNTVPASLKRVDAEVSVAGCVFTKTFPALPGEAWQFEWDGNDAYGREVLGTTPASIKVDYVYDGFYGLTSDQYSDTVYSFGYAAGMQIPGKIKGRKEVSLTSSATAELGGVNACRWGLGGWTLNVHHVYDPVGQTLYYGDGRESGAGTLNILRCIRTKAGTGTAGYGGDGASATAASLNQPADVCAAADGTLYIADAANNRIRKVSPQGVITTLAGTGAAGYSGDGGPAAEAELNTPASVAVCAHGVVYVADSGNHAVRKITPDGVIHTVAGTGAAGFSGDGGPAAQARLDTPKGIAVNSECAIYVADSGNRRVRRIGPDKRISTLAGTGAEGQDGAGDGGPAVAAAFNWPCDVAVAADGAVLVADLYDGRVRRVGNDGIIATVYRRSNGMFGCRAVAAKPGSSSFYVVEYMTAVATCPGMVWEASADGAAKRVAGIYDWNAPLGDGGPATAAYIDDAEGVCCGPDGVLYIADTQQHRIRSVRLDYPGFDDNEIAIASGDGSQLYVFDAAGRHLRTRDTATGTALYTFAYTTNGVLSSVTDADGLVTSVERDTDGTPTAIVGPYGHRTELALDADGWLAELTDPAGEKNLMSYAAGGLLTNVVSRRGFAFRQDYGEDGRIVSNTDPAGGGNVLARIDTANGWTSALSDALGRTNTYTVERQTDGTEIRTVTDPAGFVSTRTTTPGGEITEETPDRTVTVVRQGGDLRFGMQAPVPIETDTSAYYCNRQTFLERTVALADTDNPLSATNLIDVMTVNGRVWTDAYDAVTRTRVTTTPMGRQTRVRADMAGRPACIEVPGVCAVSNAYDAAGRLIATVQGDGAESRATAFEYADDGTLRAVRNALGETLLSFADPVGRVTNTVFADASALGLAYDRSSDPVRYTLPHGAEHALAYTPVGLTERYTAPETGAVPTNTLWTYNAARQPATLTKPDGTVVSNAYDFAGRLASVTASRGIESESVAYTYDRDDIGFYGSVSRGGQTVEYGYGGFLKLGEITSAGMLSFSYDDDFRVTAVSLYGADNAFLQSYACAYDDDGALVQAGDLTLARDASTGFLTGTALGNVTDERAFNGFGEISRYAAAVSGSPLYAASCTRDALGRIASQTETFGGASVEKAYAYDLRGRLVSVTTNGALAESYAYDLNGNRTNSWVAADLRAAEYDAQDRLLSSGSAVFSHDANGSRVSQLLNPNSSLLTAYSYDLFGQLKSVSLPDGRTVSYDRDALNRVTAKRVNGAIIKGWIYKDGLAPIAETDGGTNIVSFFVYGTSALSPDYMVRDGATYRLIRDFAGSVRLVVNADTGAVAQRLDYDSFGNVSQDTNPGFQPFGFKSGLYDSDAGLVHFGARWYDPSTGRWISKDSILLEGGLNLYAFCGNDPVNFSDPMGTDIWVGGRGLHRNINIGTQNGAYISYSFGLDEDSYITIPIINIPFAYQVFNPFNEAGVVYLDNPPNKIDDNKYLITTREQDADARKILEGMEGDRMPYRLNGSNCRNFSNDMFEFFKTEFEK
jgi:choice-of-anchor A domain-containing protein/RHS repeat-associated protein